MKNIVMILILMLGLSRVTAQVTETGGGNIPQALTTVFQNVDMSQVPTGILMSKSIYFTNVHDYSGTTLSDSTNMNINTLGWLYAMLNMAKIGTNTFPTPESLYGENSYTGTITPLIMLCERYNYIKPTAFDQNLLSYANDQLFDVAGRTQSPYVEDILFAVSPVINRFKTGNVSFVLNSDRIVQNVGNIQTFYIDFGTGNGPQTYGLGEIITASLPSGTTQAVVSLRIRNGRKVRILKCRFDIEVEQAVLTPESGGLDEVYRISNSKPEFARVLAPNGSDTVLAEMTTFFACTDQKLRKPLLILDGFNSGSETNADEDNITLEKFLTFFNTYANTPITSSGNNRFITQDLRKDGYDLIFVNWKSDGGRADLRHNALLLQEILRIVNRDKVGTEKNVIIGISMGGVVAKYAILDSERNNPTLANGGHDVKLLIGYDSPMQGANISLGFQYFVKDFADEILLGLGLAGASPKLKKGKVTLQSMAARQLLTYQAYDFPAENPLAFRQFFTELNSMGKPQKCDYKTVSNGSVLSTPNFPAGKQLMAGGLLNTLTSYSPVGYGISLNVDVRALPPTSANRTMIYERTLTAFYRILGTRISRNLLPPKRVEIANLRPLDGCPGGTTNVTGDVTVWNVATNLGFGAIRGARYDDGNREPIQTTFIPIVSALDIQTTNVFLNVANQPSLVTSGFVGSSSNPQFDAAQFIAVSERQNRISNQVHAGLSYRTTGFLLYNLITRNPLETSANVALNNRTYNFGVNALGFPSAPPSPGNFQAKALNNIIDYTLNVTNTGQLWVNRGGKIGFTDDVNAPTNADNSPYSLIIQQADGCKSSTDNALGIVNVGANGIMHVGDGSTNNLTNVRVRNGGTLKVQSAGNLILERSATRIDVENGGSLVVEMGGNLNLTGLNTKIVVKTGGKMTISDGANINLTGLTSSILVETGGELIINGKMNYTGVGYFQFDVQHILTLGADLVLRGSGKTNTLIKLTDAPGGTVNKMVISGRSVNISEALISYGVDCQIEITNNAVSQTTAFTNVAFTGFESNAIALNCTNTANVRITGCDFDNLSDGIIVNGNSNPGNVALNQCKFNSVNNCLYVKDVASFRGSLPVLIGNCDFTYAGSFATSNPSGIACKLENTRAAFYSRGFTGKRQGNGWENFTAIELINSYMGTYGSNIISNFKTGINADAFSIISTIGGFEISNCETGINSNGGLVNLYCSRLVNNLTGIKGSNVRFGGVDGKIIGNGNEFKNLDNPNSLLFDIFYTVGVFGTPLSEGNISASNNYWTSGFDNTKFNILKGKCPTCDPTNGGPITRRSVVQYAEAAAQCVGNWVQSNCGRFQKTSDGLNPVTGETVNCAVGGGGTSDALIMQKPNAQTATKTDSDKLIIYPNPATETVKLDIDNGNYTLKVLNTVGQTVFEQNTEGSLSVNVATWTNGIYLFEVTNKATNQRQRSKVVVQH